MSSKSEKLIKVNETPLGKVITIDYTNKYKE